MTPKNRTLKLYVWEGVLTDYSDGMAVALAYDVRQARALLIEKGVPSDEIEGTPKVCRAPAAFYVYGGG